MKAVVVKDMIRLLSRDGFVRKVGSVRLAALFDDWEKGGAGKIMPGPADIDAGKIQALSSLSGLVAVTREGSKYVYRRRGSRQASIIPRQVAERALEMPITEPYARSLAVLYTAVSNIRRPIFTEGEWLGRYGCHNPVKRLLLPVSSTGSQVDIIFYAALPQNSRQDADQSNRDAAGAADRLGIIYTPA